MRTSTEESADFEFIIALVYERSRIHLHDGKRPLIRARLARRMRHHGFEELGEYCAFLRESRDEEEITCLIDALTTNHTGFLREEGHFQFLVSRALPEALSEGQRRFNIWSAACATGEEPYSAAMYLDAHFPPADGWDWRILATDISTRALATARQGIYPAERLAAVPAEWQRRFFQRGTGRREGHYRVKPRLGGRMEFAQLNLLDAYEPSEQFAVIFCRNVMIYFDRSTQEQLVHRLHRYLAPGGFLLIGLSESLNGLNVPLHCVKPSIYRRA